MSLNPSQVAIVQRPRKTGTGPAKALFGDSVRRHPCRWQTRVLLLAGAAAVLAGCDAILPAEHPAYGFNTTPAGDCKVTIWLKAYINPLATNPSWIATILPPSAHAGTQAVVLNPLTPAYGSPDRYLTDNRGASKGITASSRMHSQVVFGVPAVGHPKLFGLPSHSTGWTVGIDRNAGVTPPTDTDVCWAVAPETGMSWNSNFHAGDTTWINLAASGGNPCPPSYVPVPPWSIDYQGRLKLMNMGSHVHIAFAGAVDGYPSYEMYASDGEETDAIFVHSNWGNHPGYLSGGADIPVSGSAKLCHRHEQGHGQGGG